MFGRSLFGGWKDVGALLYHLKLPNKHLCFASHHFAYYLKVSACEAKNLSRVMCQTTKACYVCFVLSYLKSWRHIYLNLLELQIIELSGEGGYVNFNVNNYEPEIPFLHQLLHCCLSRMLASLFSFLTFFF